MRTWPQLPQAETLTIEFKSDVRKLSDKELIEAVVCLANSDGGDIYLGVEDNGEPTGLHAEHQHLAGLPSMIAGRTSPRVTVEVERIELEKVAVARISVPKSHEVVATSDGTFKRRRLDTHGKPECVPMLPHEITSRLSDLRSLDVSSEPVAGATQNDLDPAERGRVRQFIERYGGDSSLLGLGDGELDGALGLTARRGSESIPTLTGLLLIGKETSLRQLVPTHEVAFQVLEGEEVRLNEFFRTPLLRLIERVEDLFKPLNPQAEVQAGLFRVPVPRIDPRAFREALANAVVHRDYTRRGAIHIRLETDALVISNPGGFVEGVSTSNLLTTEPRPRNPALADALKRLGLVERTGRGVDLIYRGLLRYGRARPDYSRSDSTSVVLRMPAAEADLGFLRLVLEQEAKTHRPLPIDSLIALSVLREQRCLGADELADAIQKDRSTAKITLEALVESGLVEGRGNTRAKTYHLAASVYQTLNQKAAYTLQTGFEPLQHEQLVLSYLKAHATIRRHEVIELCKLTPDQATKLLQRLSKSGRLDKRGEKKGTHYVLVEGSNSSK
jgi:ATP-dependent DNA helicase RecG